jgi:predicted ATPase
VYTLLGDRKVLDLIDLDDMTDQKYLAAVSLLSNSITSCYFVDIDLALYLAAKVTSFSIKYGHACHSFPAYILFGWLEKNKFNTFDNIFDWGTLSLRLCEKYSEHKQHLVSQTHVWLAFGGKSKAKKIVYILSFGLLG